MTEKELIPRVRAAIERRPGDVGAYGDLFELCRNLEGTDFAAAHETNLQLRRDVVRMIRGGGSSIGAFYELYRKTLLFDAPHFFDPYMLYLEIDRPPRERFYQPRRRVLRQVADAIQDLAEDRLDELFISMPPRVGKTTVLMFLLTWIIGRNGEVSNLYSAFSDTITGAMYSGVLEVITDPVTYRYGDVFPTATVARTDAKDETIDMGRRKRYPSLTCRSLYGTLNGACDCAGFLISDDLIGGIEEALNKDRMMSAWSKVDNNLLPRAKEKAKILWCGTRWSVVDPAGLRIDLLSNDERFRRRRWRVINLSALDERDESRFDYDYGVGFSSDYYRQRRASFERNNDMASWNAQYMGEPIEREGALFTPDDFRYYNGVLPEGEPDRVFMAVDPAFGAGDFTAAPVCFRYGDDIYVHDVVYDSGEKNVTQPLLAGAVEKYSVAAMQIEANRSTAAFRDGVAAALAKKGLHINLTTKPAPPNTAKADRILDKASDMREHMIFRESGTRSRAYELFMQNVFSYKLLGKNKHDDAPDSLAMAIDMALGRSKKMNVFRRTI